jgi:hypothetical protein
MAGRASAFTSKEVIMSRLEHARSPGDFGALCGAPTASRRPGTGFSRSRRRPALWAHRWRKQAPQTDG